MIALLSDAGLRASLLRHDALVEANEKPPRERGRVRALFALAHAVVTERARYDDGWSKPYEWGDVDAVCALRACDAVLDTYHRSHTWRPRTCPGCRCGTPSSRTYGARLERESDRRSLKAISALLISQEAFSQNDKALPYGEVLGPLPDGFDSRGTRGAAGCSTTFDDIVHGAGFVSGR